MPPISAIIRCCCLTDGIKGAKTEEVGLVAIVSDDLSAPHLARQRVCRKRRGERLKGLMPDRDELPGGLPRRSQKSDHENGDSKEDADCACPRGSIERQSQTVGVVRIRDRGLLPPWREESRPDQDEGQRYLAVPRHAFLAAEQASEKSPKAFHGCARKKLACDQP